MKAIALFECTLKFYALEHRYTTGVKREEEDVFTVFAGAGDRVVEAFRIRVEVSDDLF